MKFLGFTSPENHFPVDYPSISPEVTADGAVSLLYLDGSKELIDFKARRMMQTKFVITLLSESSFMDIFEYLVNNTGKDIQVYQEPNEYIFGPQFGESNLTINVKEVRPRGLSDFVYEQDIGGHLAGGWELEVEAVLIKNGDAEVKQDPEFDFLVEIETKSIGFDFSYASVPTLPNALISEGDTVYDQGAKFGYMNIGNQWKMIPPITKDDVLFFDSYFEYGAFESDILTASALASSVSKQVYIASSNAFKQISYDIDNAVKTDDLAGYFLSQPVKITDIPSNNPFMIPSFKRVVANTSTLNFRGGRFYFSAFNDLSVSDCTDNKDYIWYKNAPKEYKTGFIAKEGISFSSDNLNLENGPSVQNLEGFSIKLDNSKRMHWESLGFNLLGAKVSVYVAKRQSDGKYKRTLVASGYNKTNSIDFSNYELTVEPELYTASDSKIPVTTWAKYVNQWQLGTAKSSVTIPHTYGNHDHAKMVKVSSSDTQFLYSFGKSSDLSVGSYKVTETFFATDDGDEEIYGIKAIPVVDTSALYLGYTATILNPLVEALHTARNKLVKFATAEGVSVLYEARPNSNTFPYVNGYNSGTANQQLASDTQIIFYVRGSTLPFDAPNDTIGLEFTLREVEDLFAVDSTEVSAVNAPYVQTMKKDGNSYVKYPLELFVQTNYGHGVYRLNKYAKGLSWKSATELEINSVIKAQRSKLVPYEGGLTSSLSQYIVNSVPVDYKDASFLGYESFQLTANLWLSNGYVKMTNVPDYVHNICFVDAGLSSMKNYNNVNTDLFYQSAGYFRKDLTAGISVPAGVSLAQITTAENSRTYRFGPGAGQAAINSWHQDALPDNYSMLPSWHGAKGKNFTQTTTQKLNGVLDAYIATVYVKHTGSFLPSTLLSNLGGGELNKANLKEIPYVQIRGVPYRTEIGTRNSIANVDIVDDAGVCVGMQKGWTYHEYDMIRTFSQGTGTNHTLFSTPRPYTIGQSALGNEVDVTIESYGDVSGRFARSGWWSDGVFLNRFSDGYNTASPDLISSRNIKGSSIFYWSVEPLRYATQGGDGQMYYWCNGYVPTAQGGGSVTTYGPYSSGALAFDARISIKSGPSDVDADGKYRNNNIFGTWGSSDAKRWRMTPAETIQETITIASNTLEPDQLSTLVKGSSFGSHTGRVRGKGLVATEEICAIVPFTFDSYAISQLRGKKDVRIHTNFSIKVSTDIYRTHNPLIVQVVLKKKNSPARVYLPEVQFDALGKKDTVHYPEDMNHILPVDLVSCIPPTARDEFSPILGKAPFSLSLAEQEATPGVSGGATTINNMPLELGGCSTYFRFGLSSKTGSQGSSSLSVLPLIIPHGYSNAAGKYSATSTGDFTTKSWHGLFAGRELFDPIPETMLEVRSDGTCELEDYEGIYFVFKPVIDVDDPTKSCETFYMNVSNDWTSGTPAGFCFSYKDEISVEDEFYCVTGGRTSFNGVDTKTDKNTAFAIGMDSYRCFKPSKAIYPSPPEGDSYVNFLKCYKAGVVDPTYAYLGNNWPVRTQFIEDTTMSDVLEQSAKHSYCAVTVSPGQDLYYKSVSYKDMHDYNLVVKFNESNIIKAEDALSTRFRDADNIYTRFKFVLDDDKYIKIGLSDDKYSVYIEPSWEVDPILKSNLASITPDLLKMFQFSINSWGTSISNELTIELPWCYDGGADGSRTTLIALLTRYCQHYCFNSWSVTFDTHMKYVVDGSTTLTGIPLAVGDYVEVKTWFLTNNRTLRGFVSKIGKEFYDGKVSIEVYCPAPPEAYAVFFDPLWYAGTVGANWDWNNYKYTGVVNVYPFRNEPQAIGTTASAPVTIDASTSLQNFTFTDGTYADADWIIANG